MAVTRRAFLNTAAAAATLTTVPAASVNGRQAPAAASGSLTDVPGISVGHFTDTRRPTGCTAILFDPAAAAGVDYDGSAPGESMVVMLQPSSPVDRIHALFLTGGGLFGLPAYGGVQRFLIEHKVGYD